MSDANSDVKFSLRVMVNKKKKEVLFAEADSSFADVLLSFLTLPWGTIVKILKKHYGDDAPTFGSLTTLYGGLSNLDNVHFWTEGAKSILLHPRSSSEAECKRLKLDISDSPPLEYFVCPDQCIKLQCVSKYFDNPGYCCIDQCGNQMKREIAKNNTQTVPCDDGAFTKTTASFLITDDLQIVPNAGLLQIVSILGTTDMQEAVTMKITFGFSEVMDLLKASLISSTPLSDIILNKSGEMNSTRRKCEQRTSSDYQIANAPTSDLKTMNLKLILQKSSNKLLYAEAEEDFVEFLFSFLIIPVGEVECLLLRNSLIKCMDSLNRSVADLIHDKYFKNLQTKNRLMKPNLRHGYISKNHIFQESLPDAYNRISWHLSTKFPRGQGSYLLGPRTFKVTDDLTVTPFCIVSILSTLNNLKIPISDVEELQLKIGYKEGLSILKASLTSTSALTDALLNHISNKQSKPEV